MDKIRVLIVDDSALAREAIKAILSGDPEIEVVGQAKDGQEGVKKAYELRPDVITMDLKMPLMSGIEAIEEIMQNMPVPIIVVSSLDKSVIVNALSIGAMDFVPLSDDINNISRELIDKVKIATKVKPLRRIKTKIQLKKKVPEVSRRDASKIVAIGISTGGPQALEILLSMLPANFGAGIVIVQHIACGFVDGLVEWLRASCLLDIRVAKSRDVLKSGTVFIAPDSYNMLIQEGGVVSLKEDVTKSMVHVPSIDELFSSVAKTYGENAVGVIMTGMGSDGVNGIKAIKCAGGLTIAQDEATSVVFGMNKLAIEKGYIDKVLALDKIVQELIEAAR